MKNYIQKVTFISISVLALSAGTFAQDAKTVTADFRAKVRTLMTAKDYPAAFNLFAALETGRYSLGSASVQALAAQDIAVVTDKARLLAYLQRYDDSDRLYYRVYDTYLADGERELNKLAGYYAKGTPTGVDAVLARSVRSLAATALTLANSIKVERGSSYILSGARLPAFDATRFARYTALQTRLAKYPKE